MNEALQSFVSDTEDEFHGRLKAPSDLLRRNVTPDEFADTAVLAGYSIVDILHGDVTSSDIDPEIIRAFHLQYPHAGDFVQFVKEHSGDDAALAGIVNAIKGKYFELEYVNWLNDGHLPAGDVAELATSPTQEGWDIAIKDSHGDVIEHLRLKATESLTYVKEALASHPDIDVVATKEIFQQLQGSDLEDHVTIADFSDHDLADHIHAQIDAADMTPEFGLPLLAFGIIAIQSYRSYKKGQATALEATRNAMKRGWRSLLCRGAAYASILVAHEPAVGLPVSVLARTTFVRLDAQQRFISLIDQYRSDLRERINRLA